MGLEDGSKAPRYYLSISAYSASDPSRLGAEVSFTSYYTYSDDELDKLRAEVTLIDRQSPSCILSLTPHFKQEEKEQEQAEESDEGAAPPKKVLIGWGGNAALEKAPIDLRKEFKRHVTDEAPSPRSAPTSKKAKTTASTPKPQRPDADRDGSIGWKKEAKRHEKDEEPSSPTSTKAKTTAPTPKPKRPQADRDGSIGWDAEVRRRFDLTAWVRASYSICLFVK